MENNMKELEKRDEFRANKKHGPVDVNNDAQMVKERLRLPKLIIDRNVFKKTNGEIIRLAEAKNHWFSKMRVKYPNVGKKLLSGHPDRYIQSGI